VGSEFGRIDGLAHVAALLGDRSPVKHYDVPTWLKVMHVNVNAPFILTRTLIPLLERSSDPSIVFTTSGVSVRGRAYWGAYAASKFAVEGLMQVLADELDTEARIRVNSVNPGKVRSGMRASAFPGEDAALLATPESVLSPFLYLLGPDSRDVTGCRFDAQV
jgi:NAD(P)-dependent dehydrogenase (short-subunit alcohol dehydrogenase family)